MNQHELEGAILNLLQEEKPHDEKWKPEVKINDLGLDSMERALVMARIADITKLADSQIEELIYNAMSGNVTIGDFAQNVWDEAQTPSDPTAAPVRSFEEGDI